MKRSNEIKNHHTIPYCKLLICNALRRYLNVETSCGKWLVVDDAGFWCAYKRYQYMILYCSLITSVILKLLVCGMTSWCSVTFNKDVKWFVLDNILSGSQNWLPSNKGTRGLNILCYHVPRFLVANTHCNVLKSQSWKKDDPFALFMNEL